MIPGSARLPFVPASGKLVPARRGRRALRREGRCLPRRRRYLLPAKSGFVGVFDELTLRVMNWLRHELQAYACMN